MKLLVTRARPGGAATAARLRALGHDVVLAPLMTVDPVAWVPPRDMPAAIMLTSASAVPAALAYRALPVFAVGAATARAARDAGFADVRTGSGTVQALLDAVAAAGIVSILHLCGEDRTPAVVPAGLHVEVRTVYRARLLPLDEVPMADWVLLYSPRTAAHFAAEIDRLGADRGAVSLAAISAAARDAAGPGWQRAIAAARPDEDALLAAIGVPCQ